MSRKKQNPGCLLPDNSPSMSYSGLIYRFQSSGSPVNLDPEIDMIRSILINHLRHPALSDRHFLQYSRLLVRMSQTNRMAHRAACLKPGAPPEPPDRFFARLYGDEPPD